MPIIGYRPAGSARGAGNNFKGRARVTYLGAFSTNVWVTEVGFRGGRLGAANAIASPVFYSQSGANSAPAALVYAPAAKTISTLMTDDRSTGQNYRWSVTNMPVAAGVGIGGGVWADDAGGDLKYGQNASGKRLYRDDTAPSVPNPFGVTSYSAEGDIDVWMEGVANRQPTARIVSPANNASTTDQTPEITVAFSDPDESLGDQFTSYRVEFWNTAGTVKHADSGLLTTTSGQIAAKQATWSPPSALPLDQYYQVRVQVGDRFGWLSTQAKITMRVMSGGSFVAFRSDPSVRVGEETEGAMFVDIVNSRRPSVAGTWTHTTGLSTSEVHVRIRTLANYIAESLGGAPQYVRSERWWSATVTSGGSFIVLYPAEWADLAAGTYIYEIMGVDTNDGESPWVVTAMRVNAYPTISAESPADEATRADYPILQATISDDDDTGSHDVDIFVKPTASGSYVGYTATHVGSGVYRLQTSATHLPSRQDYQWYVEATDPFGLTTTGTARDLHFVDPPDLTNVFPDNETITTGTPTISADVDRTITAQRVTIKGRNSTRVYYDSGIIPRSGTTISQAIPSKTLPNATDYDLIIWLQASDGLTHEETFEFRLEYPPDPAMVVTAQAVHSSIYDTGGGGMPEQKPNIELEWVRPTTAVVSNADWQRYVIEWVPSNSDFHTETWTIEERGTPGMTDTRVPGNTPGTYRVYYERWINDGFDTITSDPVEIEITADVRYTTITSELPNDPAVTLHFWQTREITPVIETTPVEILGQERPDAWSSPIHYRTIAGEFRLIDDQSGMNMYTAEDIVRDLEVLATPVVVPPSTVDLVAAALDRVLGYGGIDPTDRYQPRVLWYRDPRGNAIRFTIQTVTFPHEHELGWARSRLTGFELHDGGSQ